MSFRKAPNSTGPHGHIRKALTVLGCTTAALALMAPLGGCRGDRSNKPPRQFFPDMDDQPRWDPQEPTEFFADGRTMRRPPEHTVPFGRSSTISDEPWAAQFNAARAEFLRANYEMYDGTDDMAEYVTEIPVPVTMELLEHGRERFNIYCAVCHGYNAEGATPGDLTKGGMVGRYWSIPVPSFHDPKYLEGGERGMAGYLFQVAQNGVVNAGVQTMPPYGHALDAQDTWAVVAYIRALQRSWTGSPEDVPEAQRATLGAPPQPRPEPETQPDTPQEQPAPTTEGQR